MGCHGGVTSDPRPGLATRPSQRGNTTGRVSGCAGGVAVLHGPRERVLRRRKKAGRATANDRRVSAGPARLRMCARGWTAIMLRQHQRPCRGLTPAGASTAEGHSSADRRHTCTAAAATRRRRRSARSCCRRCGLLLPHFPLLPLAFDPVELAVWGAEARQHLR